MKVDKIKIKKVTFDTLSVGDVCLFRDEFGAYIYATKLSVEKIKYKFGDRVAYTGQSHNVYHIQTFIDKVKVWYILLKYKLKDVM